MGHQASLIFTNELTPKTPKIPVGIHINCRITSVKLGEGFFDINFESPDGAIHNKRLWDPKGSYPKQKEDGSTETTNEAKFREEASNLTHVVKIMHIVLGEKAIMELPELEYTAFLKKAETLLTPKVLEKVRVNLKLIYDADGQYSVFGNFPDYIELHVPNEEPKLSFTKWELANRLTKKEVKASNTSTSREDLLAALKKSDD